METDVSPEMRERLERLAQRRRDAGHGRPLPPPVAGTMVRHANGAEASPTRAAAPRRRHPAQQARLGALVASCATTGGLVYLFAGSDSHAASSALASLPAPITAESTNSSTSASGSTSTVPAVASTTVAAAPATAASESASDAVVAYDGDTISTRYGAMQVQAQFRDGELVGVAVLQYPDSEGKSVRINERALPDLESEALTAQSAEVDVVSGATYTSNAYAASLQSAIDEARAAGATDIG